MKLTGRDAAVFLKEPDPKRTGILLFGSDAMRIAIKRQHIVKQLIGPDGDTEMRFTRLLGAEIRKDASLVVDGMKAQGFFPGPRVVLVEDVTDAHTSVIDVALSDWRDGDAILVVTAGQLNARSKLRKLFEAHENSVSIGIYDDPPSRDEVEAELKTAGLTQINPDALSDIMTLSRELDPGDFRQTIEKLALYKLSDSTQLTSDDVLQSAPVSVDAGSDDLIHIVAEAKANEIGPMMQRLYGQGIAPTTLCITATRHFRTLHTAASNPQGPEAALSRARPPVFGPRKDRLARQVKSWGISRLESAMGVLMDTDLALRSSRPTPAKALLERAFIRIAMMRPK